MVLKFGAMTNSWGWEGGKKILADILVPINTGKISSDKLTFHSVLTHNIRYTVK